MNNSDPDPIEDLQETHLQLVTGRRRLRSWNTYALVGLIFLIVAGLVGFWLQLRP